MATKSMEEQSFAPQIKLNLDSASKSAKDSLLFFKQITDLIISHISYHRNLFEEDHYETKYICGIPFKTIKASASQVATALRRWINSALNALEQKYLKSFTLQVNDATNTPLESYTLQFSFQNNEIECNFITPEGQMKLSSGLREEVVRIIRNIVVLTSGGSSSLPDGATATAIISYQPGTPQDYEAPGFQPLGSSDTSTTKEKKYDCGEIRTPFHTMALRVKYHAKEASSVSCLCGKTDVSANLLKCGCCGKVQHAACFKVFTEDDVSQKEHTCLKCSNIKNLSAEYLPEECIFRRAIVLCAKSKSISIQKIMQVLDLDSEHAELCMRRLMREGAVKKSTQPVSSDKIDFLYNVNKQKIINDLKKKYF